MTVQHALVVDDSKSARVMLSRLLQKGGLRVDLVESAEEALDFLKTNGPDMIFMDHMMPGMDGLEATRAITQNPQTAAIPVVMYTSKEGDDYLAEAKSHGAIGVLPKPAKPHEILAVLEEVNAYLNGDARKIVPAVSIPSVGTQSVTANTSKAVDALVADAVAIAMERFVRDKLTPIIASSTEAQISSISKSLEKESNNENFSDHVIEFKAELSSLKDRVDLCDYQFSDLDSGIKELRTQLSTVNAGASEDVVAGRVSAVIDTHINAMSTRCDQLSSRIDMLADRIEALSSLVNATSKVEAISTEELKVIAETAGASAAAVAAEQVTMKCIPEIVDRALEDRLNQVAEVYPVQAKSSRITSAIAIILSLVAIGAVLFLSQQ